MAGHVPCAWDIELACRYREWKTLGPVRRWLPLRWSRGRPPESPPNSPWFWMRARLKWWRQVKREQRRGWRHGPAWTEIL